MALDMALRDPGGAVPSDLLRDRLAVGAALACLALEGRSETEAGLRDAICLTRAGDSSGPSGEMCARWRALTRLRLSGPGWAARLMGTLPQSVRDQLPEDAMERTGEDPATRAAAALAMVLRRCPREETAGLMLADAILARALGWSAPVPLLAAHMPRRTLRTLIAGEGDPLPAVHAALISGCDAALRRALDLSRRAARLTGVAPKLRAKGADAALKLFLTRDAVSPTMLSPRIAGTSVPMSDRAARRLCDRLVSLGVARELTGRPSFRLYGL